MDNIVDNNYSQIFVRLVSFLTQQHRRWDTCKKIAPSIIENTFSHVHNVFLRCVRYVTIININRRYVHLPLKNIVELKPWNFIHIYLIIPCVKYKI